MHSSAWVLVVAAVAAAVYGPMVDSAFTWFYVPLTVFYAGLLEWIDRRLHFRDSVRWGLTIAALGNLAAGVLVVGGDQFYVYPLFGPVWVDDVQHFTAAAIASWAMWSLLGSLPPRSRATVAVLAATGLGALIEVGEFIGASLFETNVGGYDDTMMDFVVNLSGATIAGVVSFVRSEREGPPA